ncbi:hypothetical protein ACNOYE_32315 [Nannocystaceae bacterium ST9]
MPAPDWLPQRSRDLVDAALAACVSTMPDELRAICLIGGAARRERDLRGSSEQLELLIVVEALPTSRLTALAEGLREPLKGGLQLRTVTRAELLGSVDVQALELAEWRDHHVLLFGDDPFSSLVLAPADLRHEIERALRGLSQRLRNRLLWCMATEQRRLDVVLREGVDLLLSLAHHTLALIGEVPEHDDVALIGQFGAWIETDVSAIEALRHRLMAGQAAGDPLTELASLAAVIEAACVRVDALELG